MRDHSPVRIRPTPPAAVLFDLDGLLVDSEDAWAEAERAVVASFGAPWADEVRTLLLGRGPDDAARRLARWLGVDDVEEVGARMLRTALAAFGAGLRARPGAARLLAEVAARVPSAVVTSSPRVLAMAALVGAGMAAHPRFVITAEDVPATKPDPAPYLLACARLGVAPDRAVVLEDSPVGVAAARAAGCWVLGCPSLAALDGADEVVASLADVDPAALVGAGR